MFINWIDTFRSTLNSNNRKQAFMSCPLQRLFYRPEQTWIWKRVTFYWDKDQYDITQVDWYTVQMAGWHRSRLLTHNLRNTQKKGAIFRSWFSVLCNLPIKGTTIYRDCSWTVQISCFSAQPPQQEREGGGGGFFWGLKGKGSSIRYTVCFWMDQFTKKFCCREGNKLLHGKP